MENYYLYRLAIWLVARLPRWVLVAGADVMADVSFVFNGRSRRGIMANQSHALPPGTSRWERWRMARAAFRYSALAILDLFRISQMEQDNLDQFVAEVIGWEHIGAAMRAGKGGIFVTLHMGSWELAGAYEGMKGVPLTVVALPHKDPRIDRIYLDLRRKAGMEVVPVDGALSKLQDALRGGRFIAILADRDVSGRGRALPFFGRVTRMPAGHAVLALRTGAWILPACVYRRPDGKLTIEFRSPIVPDPRSDSWQDLTLRCMKIQEEFIRARPEQWASFYDLWDEAEAPRADAA